MPYVTPTRYNSPLAMIMQQQAMQREQQPKQQGSAPGIKDAKDIAGVIKKVTEMFGGGSNIAQTAGANAAWNAAATGAGELASTPALNAAWNAAATDAGGGLAQGGAGLGSYAAPIAGAVGIADILKNKRQDTRGHLQGAGSGYLLGTALGGPLVGAALGAALPAVIGAFETNRWKTERKKLDKLKDEGVHIPDFIRDTMPDKGRSREELVAIEQANKAAGKHSNEAFAKSRDVGDLTPEDIWGYATFFEKYGDDWLGKFSEEKRRNIAQQALDAGAVSEGRGSVDVDWSKIRNNSIDPIARPIATTPNQPSELTPEDIKNLLSSSVMY